MPSSRNVKDHDEPKTYLDYLDKEITFCGIITTFCLACSLFMVDKMFSKAEGPLAIDYKSPYFISALALFFLAAFFLFKQRSELAYHYGQISLEITKTGFTGKLLNGWLKEVDSWRFWNYYYYAITMIFCAFGELLVLLIITVFSIKKSLWWQYLNNYSIYNSIIIVILVSIAQYFYIKSDERKKMKTVKAKAPHYKVYTRIGKSKVHKGGVGIIAIADIPKDEYIFYPDDDEMVEVKVEDVTHLPDKIKKLYADFCVKEGDHYLCPVSFNKITPAWYLNCSKTPNVYCDKKDLRFKALRDIKEGEELTSDYSTYSED